MSEAKVRFSANVWVEVVGLAMAGLGFVNAFGFVPSHVLKPAMRINVSISMLLGTSSCYSRESASATKIVRPLESTADMQPQAPTGFAEIVSDDLLITSHGPVNSVLLPLLPCCGPQSFAPTLGRKKFKFFEMSAGKIFRKGEANQQPI